MGYGTEDFAQNDGFWLYRKSRLNYYGMTALLARVQLYMDEKNDALKNALEVINSKKFQLMTEDIILGRNVDRTDEINTAIQKFHRYEYISSLYVYGLDENRSENFFSEKAAIPLLIGESRRSSVFTGVGVDIDWRNTYLFERLSGQSNEYVAKYMSGNNIPLLKLSEMYLIAAESSKDIKYIDILRYHRGYMNYPLSGNENLEEILREEYQKEFIGEGQLFYFYKRLNLTSPYSQKVMDKSTFVLPIPDDELEFGDINP